MDNACMGRMYVEGDMIKIGELIKVFEKAWNSIPPNALTIHEKGIDIQFSTNWNPLSHVIKNISKSFPSLKIWYYYEQELLNFSGYEKYKNGKLIKRKSGKYLDYNFTEGKE